jgi:hypothetical protein
MELGCVGVYQSKLAFMTFLIIQAHEDYGKSAEFPDFLKYVEPCVDMPGPPPIIHVKLKPVSALN